MLRQPNSNRSVLLNTMIAIRFFAAEHQKPANRLAMERARMASFPSYRSTTTGQSGLEPTWNEAGMCQGDSGP